MGEPTKKDLPPIKPKAPATEPWRPVSMLEVTGKEDGYRYRWVRKDLLDKRVLEGWEPVVATKKARVEAPEATIIDGTPLSTYVIKRGLVLCRMPLDRVQARTEYYRRLSRGAVKKEVDILADGIRNEAAGSKSAAYGKIEVTLGE